MAAIVQIIKKNGAGSTGTDKTRGTDYSFEKLKHKWLKR